MIIEMRTYTLRPGSIAEAEKRFGEALPAREKHSKLAAFWHSEVGPLNQIIHVWGYDSFEHRTAVRAAASKEAGWPPNIREFVLTQQSEVFLPAPFSPPLEPKQVGPIFEIRQYTSGGRCDPRHDRSLGCEDRRSAEVLAAGGRVVHRVRCVEQMVSHLGLQGYQPTLRGARQGARRRCVAAWQPARHRGEPGQCHRDAVVVLTDPLIFTGPRLLSHRRGPPPDGDFHGKVGGRIWLLAQSDVGVSGRGLARRCFPRP